MSTRSVKSFMSVSEYMSSKTTDENRNDENKIQKRSLARFPQDKIREGCDQGASQSFNSIAHLLR